MKPTALSLVMVALARRAPQVHAAITRRPDLGAGGLPGGRRCLALLLLLLVVGGTAIGQDEESAGDTIQSRIAELKALESPSETEKAELAELKSAIAFRARRSASTGRMKELAAVAGAAPDQLVALKSELGAAEDALESSLDPGLPPPPPGASSEVLEKARAPVEASLATARAQRDVAVEFRARAVADRAAQTAREKKVPDELADATGRRQEVVRNLAAFPPESELSPLLTAQKANLQAEADALAARIAELGQELETNIAMKSVREALVALAEARAKQAKRVVGARQNEVDDLRGRIAARRVEDAEAARRSSIAAHPVVATILERNAELAAELTREIAEPRRERNEQAAEAIRILEELEASLERIRAQIEKVGLNSVMGLRLRALHARLTDLRDHDQRANQVRKEIERANIRAVQLEVEVIRDPTADAERRLAGSDAAVPGVDAAAVQASASEALRTQQEYIEKLRAEYVDYADNVLLPLHAAERKLADLVDRSLEYVEQRWLWIQSTHPIGVRDLRQLGPSLAWLVDGRNWTEVVRAAVRPAVERPFRTFLWFLPFIVLFAMRLRLFRYLDATTKQVRRASTDRFIYTLRAAGVTSLLALTWPSLLLAISSLVREGDTGYEFTRAAADGLERSAWVLLGIAAIWHLCRPGGLGEGHFKWYADSMRLVRRNLPWLAVVGIPMEFIFVLTQASGNRSHDDSLGRLAYCVSSIVVAGFTWRVLHPERGLLRHAMARMRGGWIDRLRPLWFPALVLSAPAAALTACLGYFLSARAMTERTDASAALVLGGIVVFALLLRWLYVAQRRLAFEEMLRRMKAEREAAVGEEEGSEEPPPPEDIELDVEEVGGQTRRLVRSAVVVFLLVGLFKVWEGALPALGIFREMVLWIPTGVRAAMDGSGTIPVGAVTVADLGLAIIILFVTAVVSRNIPGTLEILVLRHMPMSPGGKYTIRTLVRYAIVIMGIFLAFDAIGVGWGSVQWLAAGVSVGLGFGLQEIFANFVSGLIILTERPVRIGDIVTVGNVSGTITRIQMRATTITDWDRKEIIIPNKSFVTGEITNWTLSQQLLRITMPIGIAYGSDLDVARRLLLQVAEGDRHVMETPSARALFVGFGESSLDFELRVYIEEADNFSRIRDGLLMEVDAVFRKAGIVIAFPQRHVHLEPVIESPEVSAD